MSVIAPDALLGPAHLHPHAGGHVGGGGDVEGVQERGVGAVEGDQRERERPVEGLAGDRLGHPGPRGHGAGGGHLDEVGDGLMGHRVVLRRRDGDPPVRRPAADDDAVAQPGEEPPDHGSGRARVVEGDRDRSRQGTRHGTESRTRSTFLTSVLPQWRHETGTAAGLLGRATARRGRRARRRGRGVGLRRDLHRGGLGLRRVHAAGVVGPRDQPGPARHLDRADVGPVADVDRDAHADAGPPDRRPRGPGHGRQRPAGRRGLVRRSRSASRWPAPAR